MPGNALDLCEGVICDLRHLLQMADNAFSVDELQTMENELMNAIQA